MTYKSILWKMRVLWYDRSIDSAGLATRVGDFLKRDKIFSVVFTY